jgi:phosphatidylglycerol:prolipoprotein diacylglycerol transferase
MFPEFLRIPMPFGWSDLVIPSFGLMMVIGFLLALQLGRYLARRRGLDPEAFYNAGLIALVAGVLGARLSHVLENLSDYTNPARSGWANFIDAINIRSGGLTYYGGFLAAFPLLIWYAIRKKIPIRMGMDIIAPCLMIGLGFGRIGCLLNGCCYGAECSLPFAVRFPYHSFAYQDQFDRGEISPPAELLVETSSGRVRLARIEELKHDPGARQLARQQHSLPLHPAQIYSAITAFLIAGITLTYFTLPHVVGRGFALMLMLEGVTRFILEMLRVEPAVWGTPWSLSMWLGVGMVVLGAGLWVAFGKMDTVPSAQAAPA